MIELKTTLGTWIALKLPDDAEDPSIKDHIGGHWLFWNHQREWPYHTGVPLPPREWEIIGRAWELTEEQCALIVPHVVETEYPEYDSSYDYVVYEGGHGTAVDAFDELLEANGIYKENPLGGRPEFVFNQYGKSPDEFKRFEADIFKWQEVQEKVYNPLILKLKK